MKNTTAKWSGLLIGFAALLLLSSAHATDNFVNIKLPKGVSIELPKNWVVMSEGQRITLDTIAKDLVDIAQEKPALPFVAMYYKNGKVIGIINTHYDSNLDLTQNYARQTTLQDIKELDVALKENIVKPMKAFGISVLSWEGTKKSTINGITVFITEYHRKALKGTGAFRVRLVRVFAGNRSFTLTVSYSKDEAFFLKTITDRIISSLRLTGINKASAATPQVYDKPTSNTDSAMTQMYGESWGITLIISALLTCGIGLTPPLLIRFLFMRRPIGKGWAIGTAAIFWFINIIIFTALGSTSKTHGALFLVAWTSYAILRKGHKKVAVGNVETTKNA